MWQRTLKRALGASTVVFFLGGALLMGCQDEPQLFAGCSTGNLEACPSSQGYDNPYEGQLELLSWPETLRKASLELTGKLPTESQLRATEENGQLGLEASLAEMMQDQAFLDRVKELYNDHFLTDKYLGRTNAIDLLDTEDFPNLRWYEELDDERVERVTNDTLAREALELIAYVVGQERPFGEILTANYTMASDYSAASMLGLPSAPVIIGDNPEQFSKVKIPGRPHAGILTTAMFLNRFPTSDTNRNRHRARMAYYFFLDIDINRFGSRPVDANQDFGENPTLNNPDCTVCHTTMDPVAGLFMNWDEGGSYRNDGWYDDMLAPGFNGETLPADAYDNALRWFGRRLSQNPRFAVATAKMVFEGLTGQKLAQLVTDGVEDPTPLPDPGTGGSGGTGDPMGAGGTGGTADPMGAGGTGGTTDPMGAGGAGGMGGAADPGLGGALGTGGMAGVSGTGGMGGAGGVGATDGGTPPLMPPPPIDQNLDPMLKRAYERQQDILGTVTQRFVDSGLNFKVLVREIILTPYFRAKNASALTNDMKIELSTFGTARWLTPEHLNRKIQATMGVPWRQDSNRPDQLLSQYRIFYGGIDSDQVTKRVTDPNGVMASLAQRMAYEVACRAVPYDFSKPQDERLLFPTIQRGDAIENSARIREAVQHLHDRILGEQQMDGEEIEATMQVLTEAYTLGRQGIALDWTPTGLNSCGIDRDPWTGQSLSQDRRIYNDEQYSIRAWMAAVSYLLSDYRFLYE